jgi:hypothetical protein
LFLYYFFFVSSVLFLPFCRIICSCKRQDVAVIAAQATKRRVE